MKSESKFCCLPADADGLEDFILGYFLTDAKLEELMATHQIQGRSDKLKVSLGARFVADLALDEFEEMIGDGDVSFDSSDEGQCSCCGGYHHY